MGSGNSQRTHAIDHVILEVSSRTKKPASAVPETRRGGAGASRHSDKPAFRTAAPASPEAAAMAQAISPDHPQLVD